MIEHSLQLTEPHTGQTLLIVASDETHLPSVIETTKRYSSGPLVICTSVERIRTAKRESTLLLGLTRAGAESLSGYRQTAITHCLKIVFWARPRVEKYLNSEAADIADWMGEKCVLHQHASSEAPPGMATGDTESADPEAHADLGFILDFWFGIPPEIVNTQKDARVEVPRAAHEFARKAPQLLPKGVTPDILAQLAARACNLKAASRRRELMAHMPGQLYPVPDVEESTAQLTADLMATGFISHWRGVHRSLIDTWLLNLLRLYREKATGTIYNYLDSTTGVLGILDPGEIDAVCEHLHLHLDFATRIQALVRTLPQEFRNLGLDGGANDKSKIRDILNNLNKCWKHEDAHNRPPMLHFLEEARKLLAQDANAERQHIVATIGKFIATIRERSPIQSELKVDGRTLLDRFDVEGVVGGGATSTVWRAIDRDDKSVVAIKIYHAHFAEDADWRRRLETGLDQWASIESNHVVPLYRIGGKALLEDDGKYFAILRYMPGGDASRFGPGGDSHLSTEQALRLILDAAKGLADLHDQNLGHFDVKPNNILLDEHGRAHLADIDGTLDVRAVGASGTVYGGTFFFAAPEVTKQPARGSLASDVYSLGITALYLLLASADSRIDISSIFRTPDKALRELGISKPIAAVLERAFALDSERQQNGAAFLEALSKAIDESGLALPERLESLEASDPLRGRDQPLDEEDTRAAPYDQPFPLIDEDNALDGLAGLGPLEDDRSTAGRSVEGPPCLKFEPAENAPYFGPEPRDAASTNVPEPSIVAHADTASADRPDHLPGNGVTGPASAHTQDDGVFETQPGSQPPPVDEPVEPSEPDVPLGSEVEEQTPLQNDVALEAPRVATSPSSRTRMRFAFVVLALPALGWFAHDMWSRRTEGTAPPIPEIDGGSEKQLPLEPPSVVTPGAGRLRVWKDRLGSNEKYIRPWDFTAGTDKWDQDIQYYMREREEVAWVQLRKPYWIQTYEVTNDEWQQVMDQPPPSWVDPKRGLLGSDDPVNRVDWYDAVHFANTLSERRGFEKCYQLSDCTAHGMGCAPEAGDPTGWDCYRQKCSPQSGRPCKPERGNCREVVFIGSTCEGYRLPTEAEWAFAARGGADSKFWWGDDVDGAHGAACIASTCGGIRPVRGASSRQPNSYGLYDMLGNVSEWCHDVFNQRMAVIMDPGEQRFTAGKKHVIRGGSAYQDASFARLVFRGEVEAAWRSRILGFRLVRTASDISEELDGP